ncbi:MAG: hypothetical protein E7012_02815 [Alphaproteobacteria bacterium]|nr:hypothetical protein [Alphaproteobacteria bacterium]
MTEVKGRKNRGVGGLQGGLETFIDKLTEKGLELAEGAKCLQRNMPETYKGVKKARALYMENNIIASGKSKEVRGRAAEAIAMVVDGLGKDTSNKLNKLLNKINPFKKKTVQFAPVVSKENRGR